MISQKKISVIVPVYNVDKYLPRCLKSLQEQTLDSIEFLLIDDGSPDCSPEVCEEMALSDDRFCVIHKPNGGQSATRNVGISISQGGYLAFVDSDDYVLNQPFEYAYNLAKDSDAHIVCMENLYGFEESSQTIINNTAFKTNKFSAPKVYDDLLRRKFSDSPWNKLFKKSLFNTQMFDVGKLNEDFLLLSKLLKNDITVLTTNYIGYYYRLHEGSTTGSGFKQNMIDALYNAHYVWKNVPYSECINATEEYFLYKILMFLINMPKSYMKEHNKDYMFAMEHLNMLKTKIKHVSLSQRDKLLLRLFLYQPILTKIFVDNYMKMKG